MPDLKTKVRSARPKLAATIILIRGEKKRPQVLLGKRSARHDFMPSIYVFPGGRVDLSDSYAPSLDHLKSRPREILEHAMPPARARACALAAVRETFEETGLILGEKHIENRLRGKTRTINDPSWKEFHKTGYLPRLKNLDVVGRAITPPTRGKRFDTWFFLAKLDKETANRPIHTTAELIDLNWYDVDDIDQLDIHGITQMMLGEAVKHLGRTRHPRSVLFSRMIRGKFHISQFPDYDH